MSSVTRKVRLASKVTPEFVVWMQAMKQRSERREESFGECHTYNHHFLKMNFLYEVGAPDLIAFLQWRVVVLNVFQKSKEGGAWTSWSVPKQIIS